MASKRESLLDFDRGSEWEPPYAKVLREQREQEARSRALEEEAQRKRTLEEQSRPAQPAPSSRPEETQRQGIPGFVGNAVESLAGLVMSDPAAASLGSSVEGGLASYASGSQGLASAATAEAANTAGTLGFLRDMLTGHPAQTAYQYAGAAPTAKPEVATSLEKIASDFDVEGRRLYTQAQQAAGRRESELAQVGTGQYATRIVGNVLQNPTQAASVIPYVGAAIESTGSLPTAFAEAKYGGGLSDAAAFDYAATVAGEELAINALLPGPLNKIPGLGPAAKDAITNSAALLGKKLYRTGVKEGTTELITDWAGLLTNEALTQSNDAATAKYAKDQAAQHTANFFDRSVETFLTGAVGGTMIGGPLDTVGTFAELGRQKARARQEFERQSSNLNRTNEVAETVVEAPSTPAQLDMFGAPAQGAGTFEQQEQQRQVELERDAGFTIMQRQRREEEARERQRLGIEAELDQARQQLQEVEDRFYTERARGGRQGLDMVGQQDLATVSAATKRVQDLESELANFNQPQAAPQAEQAAPTPYTEGTQQELFPGEGPVGRTPAQQAAFDKAKQEALKGIKQGEADLRGKAQAARNAARRKHLTSVMEANKALPVDQRAEVVANAAVSWDNTNPLEGFLAQAQAKAETPATGKKGKKTKTEVQSAELAGAVGIPLSQATRTEVPLTPSSIKNIAAKVTGSGRGDNRTVMELLNRGKIKFVETMDQLPFELPGQTKGAYNPQTGDIYVVASNIDDKNIMGDLLSVLSHENLHGGTNAPSAGQTRKSFKNIIGKDAEKRIIANMKRAAASPTSSEGELARAVFNNVRQNYSQLKEGDGIWEQEVVANMVNAVHDTRKGFGKDLVSAVRTGVKKLVGRDVDINLNDLKYLSKDMLREYAVDEANYGGGVEGTPLSMVLGEGATGFAEADEQGLTYRSKDGKRKFVKSDANSTYKLTPQQLNDIMIGDKPVTLGDAIDHPELYEQYPWLKDIRIQIEDMRKGDGGVWNPDFSKLDPKEAALNGSIRINRGFIREMKQKPDADIPATLHQLILHETQHAIQTYENSAKGGNWSQFYTPADRRAITTLNNLINGNSEVSDNLRSGVYRGRMGAKGAAGVQSAYASKLAVPDKLRAAADAILNDPESDRVVRQVATTLKQNVDKVDKQQELVQEVANRAEKKYRKLLGEQEAYFTDANIKTKQEDLPINPEVDTEKGFGDQESYVVPYSDERVDFSNMRTVEEEAADASAPMAQAMRPKYSVEKSKTEEFFDKAKTYAKRLLAPAGISDADLRAIAKHAADLPASLAVQAENLGQRFRHLMNVHAEKSGKDIKEFRAEIEKRIDQIDAMPDPVARKAAYAALDRQYPGIGKALSDLRSFKWDLSKELVRLRMRDPAPLNEKELAVYKKLGANQETWNTRAYLASLLPDNRYGKHLLKKADEDPNSEEGKKVQAAIDWLIDNDLTIPDRDTMEGMSNKKLERLYDTWLGGSKRYTGDKGRTAMINRLEAMQTANRAELEAKAIEIIRDMVLPKDTKGGVIAQYYRGGKQNRTIITPRENVPAELRALMGEVTDPYQREMVSVARQSQLIAKTKLLTEIYEGGKDKWWSDSQGGDFQVQLESEAFGPLAGKWVSGDVMQVVGDAVSMNATFDKALADLSKNSSIVANVVVQKFLAGNRWIARNSKWADIVTSWFAASMNFTGAALITQVQNGFTHKYMAKGLMDAFSAVRGAAASNLSDKYLAVVKELTFAGVLDSAQAGEFKSKIYKDIFEDISKISVDDANLLGKAATIVRDKMQIASDFYAFMDVWAKAGAYYHEKEYLSEFYKAEGETKTDEDIQREAGNIVTRTNISYSAAIPLFKAIESNVPVAGRFITYMSEVPRSLAYAGLQAAREAARAKNAKTDEGKRIAGLHATRRAIGLSMAVAGWNTAILYALDSEDEEEKEKRKTYPEWEQNNIHLELGKNKEGKEMKVSIPRLDPNGPVNDTLRAIVRAPEGEKMDSLVDGVKNMFVQNKAILAVWQLFTDPIREGNGEGNRDKNTATQRMFPQFYEKVTDVLSMGDIGENAISAIEKTVVPAPFKAMANKDFNNLPGYYTELFKLAGAKPFIADEDKALTFRSYDHNKSTKSLNKRKTDLLERGSNLSDDEFMSRAFELVADEKDEFNKMRDVYDGFIAHGRTHADAYKILEASNFDKVLLRNLRYGNFESTILSPRDIQKWEKKQRKADADMEQTERMADLLREIYFETKE